MPSFTSGWPNLAVSAAMRTWQAMASSQPPPRANPLIAARTGLPQGSRRRRTAGARSARAFPSTGPRLGLSELSGVGGDANVAGHGQLAAASQGKPVDRGDDRFAAGLEATQDGLPAERPRLPVERPLFGEVGDVGAGHERLGTGPG